MQICYFFIFFKT